MVDLIQKLRSSATKEVDLIRQDNGVFYLLLNKGKDFTFTADNIRAIEDCLDIVQASKGAAAMITVVTSTRICSSGFDMAFWKQKKGNVAKSMASLQKLLARLLVFPVITMMLCEGHLYAGGLIFALCHDYQAMKADSGRLCLSEINIGLDLPPFFLATCKRTMGPQLLREMLLGDPITTADAKKRKLLSHVYKSNEQLEEIFAWFVKTKVPLGKKREILVDIKRQLHQEAIQTAQMVLYTPQNTQSVIVIDQPPTAKEKAAARAKL